MSDNGTRSTNGVRWTDEEQLLRIAWYYYVDELTQDEIAKRMSISRASAGRLLERCRTLGLVNFSIQSQHYDAFRYSRELREKYGLREAVVVPDGIVSDDPSALNKRLGRGVAQYLQSRLKDGETLGVGWGETVGHALAALTPNSVSSVQLVTLTGGAGMYFRSWMGLRSFTHGPQVPDGVIPAPIVTTTPELADGLYSEPAVKEVLAMAASSDHAVIGIGAVSGLPTLVQVRYVTDTELGEIADAGGVGDVLGEFYDADGNFIDVPIHRRRIGISAADLKQVPNVVAAAGGVEKVPAIKGALQGGFIDALVTDEAAAKVLVSGD